MKKTVFSLIWTFYFLGSCPAQAEIYRYVDENGIWHFTNIRSDSRYKLYLPSSSLDSATVITEYGYIIDQAAEKFDMDASLIKAVIKAESDFDHRAVSKTGARGLMQLMPGTAEAMDVDNPFNPEENIFGGTKYLSSLIEGITITRSRLSRPTMPAQPMWTFITESPPFPRLRRL